MVVCGYHSNHTTTFYFYFLTTIYPPFELVVFFGLPLFVNIVCTIIIIRSLSIRMRTAEKYRPSRTSFPDTETKALSERILSYFLPTTASKSHVHSCFCFQIQCRRHTTLRLQMGHNKRSLIKYNKENRTIDQQISISEPLNDDQAQAAIKNTTDILNRAHRSRRTRDIHLSAMLISLNVFYLLLNLPFHLHQTFATRIYNENPDRCNVMFFGLIFDSLQQTFFSINFFLYVLTNRRFREEFYNTMIIIISRCRQNSSRKQSNHHRNKYRMRSSSTNISTTARSYLNSDAIMLHMPSSLNNDSVVSDMESISASPTQQQIVVSIDDNIKAIHKLVMFKEVSSD